VFRKDLPYDPVKSFTAITLLGTTPYILIGGPAAEARDLPGFIANTKAKPGKVACASLELQKREAERLEVEASKTDIGWGHQIRSYVLQPYQMVKDLRTNLERSDPQKMLDGDLDEFMAASLAARVGEGGDKEAA